MGYREHRETSFRRKRVVLTEVDELAFSRVLREFDRNVQFSCLSYGRLRRNTTSMKSLVFGESDEVHVILDTPAELRRPNAQLLDDFGLAGWHLRMTLTRSKWDWPDPTKKWAFDPPLLDWAEIVVGFPNGDDGFKKYAGKVLRLVDKITWKRQRFGLHACQWSQAGGTERRGLGSGILIDPSEKIELNKYYDDTLWDDGYRTVPCRGSD